METNNNIIDLKAIVMTLWENRKVFYKVWPITFVLACIWIFPQPRTYTASVKLAPESSKESMLNGSLGGLASSFGFNLNGLNTSDAIYPELYPDVFNSPDFLVGLMDIEVKTIDGNLTTDYFTYLQKHQKFNKLTFPFLWTKNTILKMFAPKSSPVPSDATGSRFNPFRLDKETSEVVMAAKDKIRCMVDKKTDVISITIMDQDPLIAATMADSVTVHLQQHIINYRTQKGHQDVANLQRLADSAQVAYMAALESYGAYMDSHKGVILESAQVEKRQLEDELDLRSQLYNTISLQLQSAQIKVLEATPSFSILQSATVPVRASAPKRLFFVLAMCILATIVTAIWLVRKEIF